MRYLKFTLSSIFCIQNFEDALFDLRPCLTYATRVVRMMRDVDINLKDVIQQPFLPANCNHAIDMSH
jgi:hypothetical protein